MDIKRVFNTDPDSAGPEAEISMLHNVCNEYKKELEKKSMLFESTIETMGQENNELKEEIKELNEFDEFYNENPDDLDAHLEENSELYSSSVWKELTNEEKIKIMNNYEKKNQINHDIMMYGHSD